MKHERSTIMSLALVLVFVGILFGMWGEAGVAFSQQDNVGGVVGLFDEAGGVKSDFTIPVVGDEVDGVVDTDVPDVADVFGDVTEEDAAVTEADGIDEIDGVVDTDVPDADGVDEVVEKNTLATADGVDKVDGTVEAKVDSDAAVEGNSSEKVELKVYREAKTLELTKRVNQSWDASIDKMPSLFFTYWQHQSLIDAKNSHGKARPPSAEELKALEEGRQLKLDPKRRYVSLGGIVYKGEDDWTIWLNEKRVTPDALPIEALNLRVYEDYIEVKWLDEYTNQIFPLRLRAHQRFNLDMRIFLPG